MLFFGIGPAAVVVSPSSTRCHRWSGSPSTASSRCRRRPSRRPSPLGRPRSQRLRKVQLPMARRTIVVGLNQTIMAALSMATIAALVNGPGLGQPVLAALQILNVGAAFVAGLLIVVMAIMLDRTTTAASERLREGGPRWRSTGVGAGSSSPPRRCRSSSRCGCPATTSWAAEFPENELGARVADGVNSSPTGSSTRRRRHRARSRTSSPSAVINPCEALLSESPWWLMAPVLSPRVRARRCAGAACRRSSARPSSGSSTSGTTRWSRWR